MKSRLNIQKLEPKAYEAMYGLENYLANSELDKLHLELIKIKASQINGCAFCINMHTKDAMKLGETNQRIFLLNAWRETTLFTEEERVILAMTEEITNISQHGLSEETYQKALTLFSENYIAIIIIAITTINAWNRIAISSHMTV
ncbi:MULTISPECIES: carboxymuconolactone decarboxylase family protein [Empedobacter]|uniref:Argininosuccinate synthase n=1 Tax=Empedobacter falsenii TaxID=343874 RepID=A0A376GI28_9FLAO|nr:MULTISPECIES: carboxymuconolactone decarboxylase family protein [Empedobacter]MDH0658720.1 carboxymuconolactone decarboxylase family protein [Empedobacter sp. GD03865]MDH0674100.1 carboxymuconolactone decarboxylase family protein [Empedobacter sp. GD03861]MDH1602122.1 carboxymuconolactone decarboxylase family protein [Empedobacter sp. GD03739]RRT93232.1 carboxymuconolactone decarboxylase family protein [Empedobacter falsenii]RRT93374.1 carboxymuconolactone decarboxylase family protein [Empe